MPFTALGQSGEACSTYTFPAIMGNAKVNTLFNFVFMKVLFDEFCQFFVTQFPS